VTLGVLVADCLPVLLSDPEAGVIGAAHAGRRGLLAGVLERTVEAMESRGATRDRIEAAIGPAICGTCYEVPEAMRTEASARIPALHALTSWGTPALDLRAGAVTVLEGMGVDRARIDAENPCTFEDQDYVSYRRDGRAGHIAGLVMRDTPGASTE
jgi:YfiH family protein